MKDYPIKAKIPIAWGEMDAFNHVNNIIYFRYFGLLEWSTLNNSNSIP